MSKTQSILAAVLVALCLASCNNKAENVTLKNEQDTLSWAMGMSLAETLKNGFYKFDQDLVAQAFENTLNNGKQPIDNETYQSACAYITFLVEQSQRDQAKNAGEEADKKQNEYLTKLASENPNIHKAPEGYYYEVLREGHGPKAKVGQRIKFDFKGSEMISGRLIEQTYGVREPIIHLLATPMFQGLLEGMQLMNAGSKYRFYFPYQLVQGANGIPPYTPVIYEVELHEIYKD